jgi:ABC-2 type transport system permease protein
MTSPAFLTLFARLKWRIANNYLADLRQHKWVHFFVALLVLIMLVGGGTAMFDIVFRYLMRLDTFGRPLMDRLIKMVLLAFFSMLIFSNLIIMLTTTYISREVEFLMSQPIGHRRLFFAKLGESVIYSSWAFVILSFPFFVALGRSRELSWEFYAGTAAMLVPYLVIPATIGAALALVMTAFFPPRKMVQFSVGLAGLGILLAVLLQRLYRVQHAFDSGQQHELLRIMRFMGVGDVMFLPSGWLGRGLLALEHAQWGEAGFWMLALWSTAAMGLVVCDALAGPFYYKGWAGTRTSGTAQRTRKGDLFGFFDRALRWLPASTRAMVGKDLTIFWRDPAQWSQLMILFGLLFIYLANIRSASGMGQFPIFSQFWQSLLSLFNIGATAFVLSILTTRFVFPMLSLEGRQHWVIGLAPLSRTRLVWIKFACSTAAALTLTLPLALFSNFMLRTDMVITALTVATVMTMSLGLSSLAVGLGALMPNFNEDNPSRIANGVGGTMNAVLSLIYISLTLALETPWVHRYLTHGATQSHWARMILIGSIAGWVVIQMGVMILPLALGLRHWRRIEF